MKKSDFWYALPPGLIASTPLPERSASRLLCLDKGTGTIRHDRFKDLPDHLNPGDLLIFNNTKVIPARLFAHKPTGANVEILIERVISPTIAIAHVNTHRTPKIGEHIVLPTGHKTTVSCRPNNLFELTLQEPTANWNEIMNQSGHIPLPHYMEREAQPLDRHRYQTVYAQKSGSIAAPTAGLHFDKTIFKRLAEKGINSAYITLHVGAGTFQPVREDNILNHQMHSEYLEVPQQVIDQIRETKESGNRVIAVGTTSVRSLETAAQKGLEAYMGETDIFIYPGYAFQITDAIITNFHLPESTLIMLVSAFAGRENILNAYQAAIDAGYRFYSYGDAMLLTT